jgi:hypothetical protein
MSIYDTENIIVPIPFEHHGGMSGMSDAMKTMYPHRKDEMHVDKEDDVLPVLSPSHPDKSHNPFLPR